MQFIPARAEYNTQSRTNLSNANAALNNEFAWFLLPDYCERISFQPGELLRRKGQHYADMYLILDGSVEVQLQDDNNGIWLSAGTPVGEIAFVKGCAATATVIARNQTTVLALNNRTLLRLEKENPQLLVSLLRALANTAEERMTQNSSLQVPVEPEDHSRISVLLCRNREMLTAAQQLRYRVYCEELGRSSPYADHDKRIISDNLDEYGHTFIALDEKENIIGTLRANFTVEGPLGILEEIYGMKNSPHHPNFTIICTKFIVDQGKRGSRVSAELIKAMRTYVKKAGAKECYIDTIPKLVPLYRRIGFTIAGEKFLHYENGPSFPMVMDLTD